MPSETSQTNGHTIFPQKNMTDEKHETVKVSQCGVRFILMMPANHCSSEELASFLLNPRTHKMKWLIKRSLHQRDIIEPVLAEAQLFQVGQQHWVACISEPLDHAHVLHESTGWECLTRSRRYGTRNPETVLPLSLVNDYDLSFYPKLCATLPKWFAERFEASWSVHEPDAELSRYECAVVAVETGLSVRCSDCQKFLEKCRSM